MAKTLTTRLNGSISWTHEETATGVNATQQQSSFAYSKSLASGTAANQADLLYAVGGSIAGGGTLTLDLTAVLNDFFGDAITFARVKVIFVWITTDTSASSVNVGGDAAALVNWVADATDEVVVRNGGLFMLVAPDATAYASTATTADILLITNNDGSNAATYRVALVGASA